MLYRVDGEPVSLFIIPGMQRPAAELSLFGHDQLVWTEGDRTYMLVARGGLRGDLARVASTCGMRQNRGMEVETPVTVEPSQAPSSKMRMIAVAATAVALARHQHPVRVSAARRRGAGGGCRRSDAGGVARQLGRHRRGAGACMANAKTANWDFKLKDIDGKEVELASFKGKVVLLNFWATWCGPCKAEIPGFVELQEKYRTSSPSSVIRLTTPRSWRRSTRRNTR